MTSQMNDTVKDQAKVIIDDSAMASSIAAGAVAQIAPFGAGFALEMPIILSMIQKLGELFGATTMEQSKAKSLAEIRLMSLISTTSLIGVLPIIGNAVSAAISYPYVQSIGWAAYEYFRNEADSKNRNGLS
jgi:uncharacterized protein (DUF697 family)